MEFVPFRLTQYDILRLILLQADWAFASAILRQILFELSEIKHTLQPPNDKIHMKYPDVRDEKSEQCQF